MKKPIKLLLWELDDLCRLAVTAYEKEYVGVVFSEHKEQPSEDIYNPFEAGPVLKKGQRAVNSPTDICPKTTILSFLSGGWTTGETSWGLTVVPSWRDELWKMAG